MVLGWSSRSRQSGQNSLAQTSSVQNGSLLPASPAAQNSRSTAQLRSALSHLPLVFEPNRGQTDRSVKFLARGAGYTLFLGDSSATLNLRTRNSPTSAPRTEALRMKLAGANQSSPAFGDDLLPGKSNYFIGNDPAKWRHDIPQFARVRYENVYPGINLVFYGNQAQLEYDFQVAPGANPAQAELEFDGSKQLELRDGSVIVQDEVAQGESSSVRLAPPRIYQQIEGREQLVEGGFVLRSANRVGFEIGPYDRTRELIIDPILTYSTYFGGSGDEHSPSIAVDNVGSVYLAGSTTSADLPVTTGTGVVQSTLKGAQNIFILKLNPSAQPPSSGILSLTYLGGTGTDSSVGVGVDGAQNVYVAGTTTSTDFPTTATNAYQSKPETGSTGTSHVFVSALNSTLSLLNYSSYLSGNGTDVASGMASDNNGHVFVTGTTTSSDTGSSSDQFPASALPQGLPFQSFPRAPLQFFVTKVNTAASGIGSIAYSTYFGGGTPSDGIAVGGGITVDSTGNIYFTGTTNFTYTGTSPTTDFPIINAYQPCLDQIPPTIVVTPPTCAGTDATTNSDAFVAKLNPNLVGGGTGQLIWSTYLGGTQVDSGTGIAVDSGANVYITGTTNSPDVTLLTTFAQFQVCLNTPVNPAAGTACPATSAATDAFVARFNNPASGIMALTYFSYLGGTGNEAGQAIAVDTASDALLTGWTQSTDFPVFPTTCNGSSSCVIQSQLAGPQDAFFAHLDTTTTVGQTTVAAYATYFGGTGTDQGTGVAVDNSLNTYFVGDTNSVDLQTAAPLQAQNNGGFDAFVVKLGTAADLAITGVLSLGTGQQYVYAGNQATFTYTVTNNGPDLATNVTVTDNLANTGIAVVGVSATATSGSCSAATVNPIVCTIASLQSGATATVTIVLTPASGGNFNGGSVSVASSNNNDPDPGNNAVTVPGKVSDFGIAVSPLSQAIQAAGDTAVYTVTLTPDPVYPNAISLTCSAGVPATATCSFVQASVTLTSTSPGSSVLNLNTVARPVTTVNSRPWRGPVYAVWLGIPGIALLGFGAGRDRRRIAGILLLCAIFALVLLQPACKGSTTTPLVGGTQAGNYTITVTATSGTRTQNASIGLTVP